MTGEKDYDKGAVLLQQKYQIPLVCVTLGKDGSRAYYKGLTIKAEPFLQKNTIETTGAGDTFTGYFLMAQEKGFSAEQCLSIAAQASAIAVSRKGASVSVPVWAELQMDL